ncbi:hypothetical protein [Nonomuraea cavernae]|uniref:Uncharacterized protein n=1 Tax=Nonomuraea cavernae TaxID=2045107 RepID=A0A917ZB98_9ACTN|nr:hypothetical protein [Nonomuraea cavernae]MCA2185637.1 hypothetical protein [Nonomuraea cavernae]GGO78125.1 hypothetical protein GCM10012289_59400 [Nonomuraea cavernae]
MRRLRWWVALSMAALLLALAVPQFSATVALPEPAEQRDCPMGLGLDGPPGAAVVEQQDRQWMYLCFAHQQFGELPDEELLARGAALCDSAVLDEKLTKLLELRCPGLYERNERIYLAARDAEDAEEKRRLAVAKTRCPRRAPIAKPVRRTRAAMWVSTGGIHAWEEGYNGLDYTGRFLTKGKGTVHLTWGTGKGDEAGPVCVTGEAYKERPPKAKGWQRSGELRFHSPTGVLEFFGDGGDPLGDVTVTGAGSYRIRAYVRGVEHAPELTRAEAVKEVLIVVFPTSPR